MYYVEISGEQSGPYGMDQLRAMWESGSIPPDAMCWTEGWSEWCPLNELVTDEHQRSSLTPADLHEAARKIGARPGNRALNYLLDRPLSSNGLIAINAIPGLARELLLSSKEDAKSLAGAAKKKTTLQRAFLLFSRSRVDEVLTKCFLDLYLESSFTELVRFTQDHRFASALVDALLFEAIGEEASAPDDVDYLTSQTHRFRGIEKYRVAKQKFEDQSDPTAWLFGKEFVTVVFNSMSAFKMLRAYPYVEQCRVVAQAWLSVFLHDVKPTKEWAENVNAQKKEIWKNFTEFCLRRLKE